MKLFPFGRSFNHLPWIPGQPNQNPPPNGAIAVGMKMNIADMDDDGKIDDLVVANAVNDAVYLLVNQHLPPGTVSFGSTTGMTGDRPSGVAAADLDGDGDADAVSSRPEVTSSSRACFSGAANVALQAVNISPTSRSRIKRFMRHPPCSAG